MKTTLVFVTGNFIIIFMVFVNILQENSDEIMNAYPEACFKRVLDGADGCSVKDSRQICQLPLIICWCLNLKHISSAAYHAL